MATRSRFRNFSRRFNRTPPGFAEKPATASPNNNSVTAARAAATGSEANGVPGSASPSDRLHVGTGDSTGNAPNGSTANGLSGAPVSSHQPTVPTSTEHMTNHARHSTQSTAATDFTESTVSSPYRMRAPAHTQSMFPALHAASKDFQLPDLPWLCGTWHVTHSTLPMWKNKKNVRITYTRLSGDKLDDLVTYQAEDGDEVRKVEGIDTPKSNGAWEWRGKGFLKFATSRWEVLGWGVVPVSHEGDDPATDEEQFVVTYFAKTLFTPAGIDIYSRRQQGLRPETIEKLRRGLANVDRRATSTGKKKARGEAKGDFGQLVDQIFEVRRDATRADIVTS